MSASSKYGIICHQVLLILNHYYHLEIHSIISICVYIRCTKRFYCFVVYLDLLSRPRYLCCIFSLCVLLSLSDFNMLDCIVFCDMLVALVALCHLFEIPYT